MALKKVQVSGDTWQEPTWPREVPAPVTMRAVYGPLADELTIRFLELSSDDIIVVVPIATPEVEYANVMVTWASGDVIGVQIDYLSNYAVTLHPGWIPATSEHPAPETIGRIVSDVKTLFDRYGVDDPNDN